MRNAEFPLWIQRCWHRLVSNVEEVALRPTSITHQQVAAIFTTIKEDSLIQRLSLRAADLYGFEISTQVLAKFVRKLETLNLVKTWLPAGIVKVISETVAESAGNLAALNMYENDFGIVDDQIMAKMVQRVEELNIGKTYLSKDQVAAIMTAIDESVGNLKSNDPYSEFEDVDAKLVA